MISILRSATVCAAIFLGIATAQTTNTQFVGVSQGWNLAGSWSTTDITGPIVGENQAQAVAQCTCLGLTVLHQGYVIIEVNESVNGVFDDVNGWRQVATQGDPLKATDATWDGFVGFTTKPMKIRVTSAQSGMKLFGARVVREGL